MCNQGDGFAKSYLETEADVEAFVTKLRAELLGPVRAGQKAQLQYFLFYGK